MKKIGIILPNNIPLTENDIINLSNEVRETISLAEAVKRKIVIPEYSPNDTYVITTVESESLLSYFWPFGKKNKETTKKTQKFRKT